MRSWLAELVRVAPGAIEARLPGLGVDARTREHMSETVAAACGSPLVAWIHGAWRDFVGRVEPDDAVEPLLAFAQASADAGGPVDATVLEAVYEPSVVRATRATVALAFVGTIFGTTFGEQLVPQMAAAGVPQQVLDGFGQAMAGGGFDLDQLTGVGDLGTAILAAVPPQFVEAITPFVPNMVEGIHGAFSLATGQTFWLGVGAGIFLIAGQSTGGDELDSSLLLAVQT